MELKEMRGEVLQILVESQDVDELLGSLDVLLSEVRAGWCGASRMVQNGTEGMV